MTIFFLDHGIFTGDVTFLKMRNLISFVNPLSEKGTDNEMVLEPAAFSPVTQRLMDKACG